jgi:hypothetical protein
MRNLLPFIVILACPVMMIFMMRGMHGGGHGSANARTDTQMDRAGDYLHSGQANAAATTLQAPEDRITQLEHELAQLRDLQSRQSAHDRARRP